MKLKDLLAIISDTEPIRIFVGCQKVFDGIITQTPEKEWNRKMRGFMDCHVIGIHASMNTILIVI